MRNSKPPVTSHVTFLLQLIFLTLIQSVFLTSGSVVELWSSPCDVKQGLTTSVTLKCSLLDSAVSAAIIGKRDVTHTAGTHDVTDNTETHDVSRTQDNLLVLSSLVVMKDGSDVASVNLATSAQIVHGSSNVKATGKISGTSGFLTVTFTDPKVNQTGEFVCEANGIGAVGHVVTLTSTVEVTSSQPTVADLVTFVREVSRKNEDLEAENLKLTQMNLDLRHDVSLIKNKSQQMEHDLVEMKIKNDQMSYFNARISTNAYYSAGQVVVFDDVVEIQGNDYDKNTGLFTCSIPGYYHFTVSCLSQYDQIIDLKLYHNQQAICRAYGAAGHSHQTGSNAATVSLATGDVVKIQAAQDSKINDSFCSFHGYLIRAE